VWNDFYKPVVENAVVLPINEKCKARVASLDDLVETKRMANRPQDRYDMKLLSEYFKIF